MMKAIWKYPFEIDDEIILQIPKGSEILCVQVQKNKPCVWIIIDTDGESINRHFRVFATGQPFDDTGLNYIGTFQLVGGKFIGHLFDAGERE